MDHFQLHRNLDFHEHSSVAFTFVADPKEKKYPMKLWWYEKPQNNINLSFIG
jgi:hypothetical protein